MAFLNMILYPYQIYRNISGVLRNTKAGGLAYIDDLVDVSDPSFRLQRETNTATSTSTTT